MQGNSSSKPRLWETLIYRIDKRKKKERRKGKGKKQTLTRILAKEIRYKLGPELTCHITTTSHIVTDLNYTTTI